MERKRELLVIIKEGIDTAMFGREGVQSTVGIKFAAEDCKYSLEDGCFTCFENAEELTEEQIIEAVKNLLPNALRNARYSSCCRYELWIKP